VLTFGSFFIYTQLIRERNITLIKKTNMVDFKGLDTKQNAVKLKVKTATIFIWKESNLTALISVRDKDGSALWQKTNCTASDLPFAIEVAKRNIKTGIFETH
jgi:hypothetical protein